MAIPLLVGYDSAERDPAMAGRIVTYDVTGNIVQGHDYEAIGSGSPFARSALKKRHDPAADRAGAIRAAVDALYDAADDDTATGGPDIARRIYPVVVSVTGTEGAVQVTETEVEEIVQDVVRARETRPGG